MWRDYVRQTGAITLDSAAYQRLTGDTRISDLALWPADGVDMAALQSHIRSAAQQASAAAPAGSSDSGAANLAWMATRPWSNLSPPNPSATLAANL